MTITPFTQRSQSGSKTLFRSKDIVQPEQSAVFRVTDRPVLIEGWEMEAGEFLCIMRVRTPDACDCGPPMAKPYIDPVCCTPICLSCDLDMYILSEPGAYILQKAGDVVGNPTVTYRYLSQYHGYRNSGHTACCNQESEKTA